MALVLALCVAGSAAPAAAQFTAAVVPPKQKAPRPAPSPVAAQPESTTIAQTRAAAKTLTNMKVWVDSAATALAQASPVPAESTAKVAPAAPSPSRPAQRGAQQKPDTAATVGESHGQVRTFRNGARAPATATPLPTLALLGIASLITGALLRRRWS
jgi:hypothetical protein